MIRTQPTSKSILLQEERKTGALLVLPTVLMLLVFVAYPVLSNIITSFFKVPLGAPPQFVGTSNYSAILSRYEFWRSLALTVTYVISTTVLTTVLGVIVALVMNQSFPLRSVARALILFPYVAPIIGVVYAWQFFFDPVNGMFVDLLVEKLQLFSNRFNVLEDPKSSVWVAIVFSVWKNFPFTYLMVLAQLQAIDHNLYEASAMDGANAVQRFVAITLPEIFFVVGATILLRIIWNFNKFEEVFLLSSSIKTLPIFTYFEAFVGTIELGKGSAIAVVQFAFVLLFVLMYVKKVLKW